MQGKLAIISRFDNDTELLKLDLSTGVGQLISTEDVNEDQISFGMFEIERSGSHTDIVALIATPSGPLLFLNDVQYRPEIGKTKISIKDDEIFSHFLIVHEGHSVFGLFYEKKFGVGLHPYSKSREDIDLYYWLCKNISNSKLYAVYTKEIKYIS